MLFGKMYKDTMDTTRFVFPESIHDGQVKCSIYFRSKNDSLVYSGKTKIPANLFTGTKLDQRMNERIGFVLLE